MNSNPFNTIITIYLIKNKNNTYSYKKIFANTFNTDNDIYAS